MLSVSQFAKDNFVFFEFHPHICLVKSQETHKVLLEGVVGVDGLYSFHILQLQGNPFLLMSTSVPVTNVDLPYSTANVNNSSNIGSKSVGIFVSLLKHVCIFSLDVFFAKMRTYFSKEIKLPTNQINICFFE